MKKIALFVTALLVAGSLFAADPVFEAKPGISGDATLTFGVALDNPVATGFANATSSNITLGLINKDSNEKGGKEGEEVYGWIKLSDFELKIDAGTGFTTSLSGTPVTSATTTGGAVVFGKPGISAKLFIGPVFIDILGTDGTTDKASGIAKAVVATALTGVSVTQTKEYKGFALGLKDTSTVDLTVGVSSLADWTGTPANTTNVYNFYIGAALKAVADLTFEVAANLSTGAGTPIGVGAKAGYKIVLGENMNITPTVGYDLSVNGAATPMEVSVEVPVVLAAEKTKVTFASEKEFTSGLTIKYDMLMSGAATTMDLGVYAFDGSLIPVLDVVAAFEMNDLTAAAANMGMGFKASATIDSISPWALFKYAATGATATNMYLEVGVDIKAITNTTFTLKYASGNLSATTPGLGAITFATKIAY